MSEPEDIVRVYQNRQRGLPDDYGLPADSEDGGAASGLGIGGMDPTGGLSTIDLAIELGARTPIKWL